jgi:hypothetical protein
MPDETSARYSIQSVRSVHRRKVIASGCVSFMVCDVEMLRFCLSKSIALSVMANINQSKFGHRTMRDLPKYCAASGIFVMAFS